MKSLKIDSTGIPALKDENFTLVTENIQKAGLLNKQFESVFTHENLDHFPTNDKPSFPCMPDIYVSVSGVEKLLSKLNIHKATGPDEIPSHILKEYASEIALHLQSFLTNPSRQVFYQRAGVRLTYPPYSKKVNTPNHPTTGPCP